jgi:hypothetical protein
MARDLLKHKFIKNAKKNSILMDLIEKHQIKKRNAPASQGNSIASSRNKDDGAEDGMDGSDAWDFGTVKPAVASNKDSEEKLGTVKASSSARTASVTARPQDSFKVPPPPSQVPASSLFPPSSSSSSSSSPLTTSTSTSTENQNPEVSFSEIDKILEDTAAMSMSGGTIKNAQMVSGYLPGGSVSSSVSTSNSNRNTYSGGNQNSLDILDLVLIPALQGTLISPSVSTATYNSFNQTRQKIMDELRVCERLAPGFTEQLVQGIIQRVDVEPTSKP